MADIGNPIHYGDLFHGDIETGIDGLISKLTQVEGVMVDMLKEVKKEASSLNKELSGVSTSTKEDRDATSQYAAEIEKLNNANKKLKDSLDKVKKDLEDLNKSKGKDNNSNVDLAKSYESLSELINETGVNIQELIKTKKQLNIADKNGEMANKSLQGSYNQLYAQYNLIKNALNAMGDEMRNSTEVGKKWEAEALRIMDAMKQMQAATGKHTLEVGNYEEAFGKAMNGLSISTQQVLREMPTLANSLQQFFIAISNNVPIFVDNLKRVQQETGSWTIAMKGVLTSLFSWQTALLALLTILPKIAKNIHDKKKAQTEDNEVTRAAVAIHKELKSVYQETAKTIDSNISQLRTIYTISQDVNRAMGDRIEAAKALKAEYEDAFKNYTAEDIALGKAKVRYEELTRVLVEQAKARAYLNKITELEGKMIDQTALRDQAKAEYELAKSKTARAKAELEAYNGAVMANNIVGSTDVAYARLSERANEAAKAEEKALAKFIQTDAPLQDIDNQIAKLSDNISGYALAMMSAGKTTKDTLNKEKDYYWDWRESVAQIMMDEEERALELNNIKYEHAIANMQAELEEQKKNGKLTIQQEEYMTDIILNLETERQQKRWEIVLNYYQKLWDSLKEDYKEVVAEESIDEEDLTISGQYEKLLAENAKKLLDSRERLNDALATGTFDEAKKEGEAFKDLTKEKLRLEAEYQKALLQMRLDTGVITADQYTIELAKIEDAMNKSIANLDKKRRGKKSIWTMLLGVTKEDGKGNVTKELTEEAAMFAKNFQLAMKSSMQMMDEWMEKRIEMANVAVEAAQRETENAKTALDYEMEARANGYANNVELARQEYEERLAIEKKAVAERERLQKMQSAIDSAVQMSSLITATAEIWKAYAKLPFVGKVLAAASIATMWGSFAAAKVTAAQMTSTKYGDGMTEYLDYGGSHASGNDIDFGADKNGRRRRVERGEMIGVINKRNVNKYGVGRITDIIESINKGTFERKYNTAEQTEAIKQLAMRESIMRSVGLNGGESFVDSINRNIFEDKYGMAFSGVSEDGTDLSAVERGINRLIEQGDTKIVTTPYGRIEYKGNNKRIIRNS